eukprot:TRINITY_DN36262_c0_g1_i1.p1 TRINITY_DN36262_c0_g1~~TRINITY_DN36262_c0_g1_i1.p1  ORF type:complete len:292 (-),score=67.16 TRINITY_DN36262_c0_g1_i1:52-927(-)
MGADRKQTRDQQSAGRSQSLRTPRRLARQFAPAGWTMCECEADKEWILCDRAEAAAGELAEQFQKHLMQDSQQTLTESLPNDKEDLPEMDNSAKEITMARFRLQLEEEEKEALRECNQQEDYRDGDENRNTLNKQSCTMAKEHIVSAKLHPNADAATVKHNLGNQTTDEVNASDGESDYAKNKESVKHVTARNRSSSRRRRAEARSGSQRADSGQDTAALTNRQADFYDAPSRKLSRAERRAANADELASQDLLSQQSQGQGKVDACDVRLCSPEDNSALSKCRAKNRKCH